LVPHSLKRRKSGKKKAGNYGGSIATRKIPAFAGRVWLDDEFCGLPRGNLQRASQIDSSGSNPNDTQEKIERHHVDRGVIESRYGFRGPGTGLPHTRTTRVVRPTKPLMAWTPRPSLLRHRPAKIRLPGTGPSDCRKKTPVFDRAGEAPKI